MFTSNRKLVDNGSIVTYLTIYVVLEAQNSLSVLARHRPPWPPLSPVNSALLKDIGTARRRFVTLPMCGLHIINFHNIHNTNSNFPINVWTSGHLSVVTEQ